MALSVALVALADFHLRFSQRTLNSLLCLFLVAPSRSFVGRSVEKDFQFGSGENHRTNVASLHHNAAAGAHLLLLCHQQRAHGWNGRYHRRRLRHLWLTNGAGHVAVAHQHPDTLSLFLQFDGKPGSTFRHPRALFRGDSFF